MKKTTQRNPRIERAIREWENLLGAKRVLTDPKILAQTGMATFAFPQGILGVIQPESTGEVQGCLRIANEFRAPVYPVSRGMNWGLGSKAPPSAGCVLMDLSGMKRIVAFDERTAIMTVEPGVTFQQGHDYLEAHGSRLMLTCTGGPKDGSVLGNALERGDGWGPYGNRAEEMCHMQVVLPNGDLIRTGPGRFAGARAAGLTRDVPGPGLDGLFLQSNLGVVTEMTVWLMPRPAYHRILSFRLGGLDSLPRFLDALQELVLEGVILASCAGVWNSYKYFMVNWRYPWGLTGGATPFVARDHAGSEPWFSTVLICAPGRPVGELLELEVRQRLGPLARDITATSSIFDPDSASLGRPGDRNARSMYWRKRGSFADGLDPERDRCGVIWLCPALPLDGNPVANLLARFEKMVREHGFEPSIGFNVVSPRCLHAFVMLAYDRDVPSEDERAMECHDRLFASMIEEGYYPYRLGIHSMALYRRLAGAGNPLIEAFKRQLDPNQILAPGRYE